MIVTILGPLGSGKSTLVRRLMSLYDQKVVVPGGVGTLPLGYQLARGSRHLTVVGNYDTTSRTRHGMGQFDRYYEDFDRALKLAVDRQPTILEGSFTKPDRLWAGVGPQFAKQTTVIYLSVTAEYEPRRGREWTPEGVAIYELANRKSAEYIKVMGGTLELYTDRESAFERARVLLGAPDGRSQITQDYR
jgi:hypothetical protein